MPSNFQNTREFIELTIANRLVSSSVEAGERKIKIICNP